MATQNPSSSSSSASKWIYDVFVSFRGEDTRKTFTDHLCEALKQKGIHIFKDDEKLERGKEISPGLLRAIEESRFSLIVLSNNYASSKWCLEELVKILECKETRGQMVLPIFYDVDPSEVRKQMGSFAKAFAKYEEEDFEGKDKKVQKWRAALTEVANLSGWDLRNTADGHEAKFIKKIVEDILSKLNQNHLYVAKQQVGIDSRVKNIYSLLGDGTENDFRIIGIWGIGGIGKTTLAKAVYNQIRGRFEGSSFLANVREVSRRDGGLVHLQRELLSKILNEPNLNIWSEDRGVIVIKERLRYKRVLIILDDVDQQDQLEKLAGKLDWFGEGSRIIITTRDERLLTTYEVNEVNEVKVIYRAKELGHDEALQLFSLNAFKKDHPECDFVELSNCVVNYANGLPLALKVLGSSLCNRSVDEWRDTLDKLQEIPNNEILATLKVSYDGLDQMNKDIFLDVACFFIGEKKDYVTTALGSCGFRAIIGLTTLTERSLITMSDNKVQMHDLLREMGQDIVRQESPKDPGKRSRLWLQKDVYRVLKKNTGLEAVEGITLEFWEAKEVQVSNEAFTGMHNLRLLKFSNVHPFGDFNCLPDELRCLIWDEYPLKSMPSRFDPKRLVQLYMPSSRIEYFSETKIFEKLEFLNLSHSQDLLETPDFSRMPELKRLTLEGCTKLVKVHPSNLVLNRLVFLNLKDCKSLRSLWRSIKLESLETLTLSGCSKLEKFPEVLGNMEHLSKVYLDGTTIIQLPSSIERLTRLVLLDLGNCKYLASLPSSICKLESLETLILSGCSRLDKLPENLGNMQNLVALFLDGTAIRQPPSSIVRLRNLQELSFRGCKGSTSDLSKSMFSSWFFPRKVPCSSSLILPPLSGLRSLRRLDLSDCNLSEGAILSVDIVNMPLLEDLNLSRNNFVALPATLSQLNCLKYLCLEDCTRLQALPLLPSRTYWINVKGCISLYETVQLYNCEKIDGNILLQRMPKFTGTLTRYIVPGSEIPKWMNHQSMGSSISFAVSPKVKRIAICAVFTVKNAIDHPFCIWCIFRDVNRKPYLSYPCFYVASENGHIESDHVCLLDFTGVWVLKGGKEEGWHHIEASFENRDKWFAEAKKRGDAWLQVKKCGVHIMYEEDDVPTMIHDNSSFHHSTLEEEEEEEEGAEEDTISKRTGFGRRLVEEEASGSPHPKRMRGNRFPCKLNQNYPILYVAKQEVGIDSRVETIYSLLGVGTWNDVRVIGIWGIGGIGKTTLAKAVYNQIHGRFEGSSFLANVREVSRGDGGLVHLQRELLCQILNEPNLNISNKDRGVLVIKERLRYKRVLIILDDVDKQNQLEKLVGKVDWFGAGSRIIVTTRDKHLLDTHEADGTYELKELNHDEALQLFSLNAFEKDHPECDFLELSNHVVNYAKGLPLALKVLGSFLCKRSVDEWRSTLDKLQKIPNTEIHKIYEEDDVPKMIHYNSSFHHSTLEEEEEEEEGAEEDIITKHTRKRLVAEEASGSPHPKRMRGNTNTVLKLKDKESS